MKIGILDLQTLGEKADFERLGKVGDVMFYNLQDSEEISPVINELNIIIVNKIKVMRDAIDSAPRLELICVTATGTNNIDVEYARINKIAVKNVQDYCTNSVAQHTFSMLFHLISKIEEHDKYVKSGSYSTVLVSQPTLRHNTSELFGKTIGIVGLGNIGKRVAQIFTAFGARIIYYSPSGTNQCTLYERVTLKELVRNADIISIHAPLVKQTENLINSNLIGEMKKNAIVINTGRGGIVDELALANALENNSIRGACLDVFSVEPILKNNPLLNITDHKKLVLTPHNAWSGLEVKRNLINKVCDNVISFIAEQKLANGNFDAVGLTG